MKRQYEKEILQFLNRKDLKIKITDTLEIFVDQKKYNYDDIVSVKDYPNYLEVRKIGGIMGHFEEIYLHDIFKIYKKYYKDVEVLFEKVVEEYMKNDD